MSKVNEYFKREEFACKCGCGFDAVDIELLKVLTLVRQIFEQPVIINSACRCESHNKKVGGASNSMHKFGKGADIRVKDVPPPQVYDFLTRTFPMSKGLGLYDSWVHIDVRENRARWNHSKYKLDLIL